MTDIATNDVNIDIEMSEIIKNPPSNLEDALIELKSAKLRIDDLEQEISFLKDNTSATSDDDAVTLLKTNNESETTDLSLDTYLKRSNLQILKQRLPWLVGLLIFQSFSATILGAFEYLLENHLVISFFVPMIVGTGGNAGNQPGVMITRALGNKEVNSSNFNKIMKKELQLSLISGSVLGLVAFLRVLVNHQTELLPALAISLTVALVVFISVFLGIGFSVMLDRFNIDPADAAALLLTTLADMIGILTLCLVSSVVL